MSKPQIVDAAITLMELLKGFLGRSESMTEEEAQAEWDKVVNHSVLARGNWGASKGAHGPLK